MRDDPGTPASRDDRRGGLMVPAVLAAAAVLLFTVALVAGSGPGLLALSIGAAFGAVGWTTMRTQRRWTETPAGRGEARRTILAGRIAEIEAFRRGLRALPWLGGLFGLGMLSAGLTVMGSDGPGAFTAIAAAMAVATFWVFRAEARAADAWARDRLHRMRAALAGED